MKKNLPLFYYPTKWIYIDDDKTLLDSLGIILTEHSKIQLFSSPEACLNFFSNYISPLEKYSFLKSIKGDENYGLLQKTPMDLDVTQIASIAKDKVRHDEISVAIIDYHMPGMDGFELAKQITHNIQRILLTGETQESKAIEGFNQDVIQRFIKKGENNMMSKLLNFLKELSVQYFRNVSLPFLSYLEIEKKLPLSDPTFIDFFEEHIKNHNIAEYYLINKEGSFLCIDNSGHNSCLIVHSSKSINSWIELYRNHEELSPHHLQEIQEHKKIPFFGVGKEPWQVNTNDWSPYLYSPQVLEGRDTYFICKIQLS